MKKDKCYEELENSTLYQTNMKIQKNLWKPYTIALVLCVMVIIVKGFN